MSWEQIPDCSGGGGTPPLLAPPACCKQKSNEFELIWNWWLHICQEVLLVPVLDQLRGMKVCFIQRRTEQLRIEQAHQLWWTRRNTSSQPKTKILYFYVIHDTVAAFHQGRNETLKKHFHRQLWVSRCWTCRMSSLYYVLYHEGFRNHNKITDDQPGVPDNKWSLIIKISMQ